MFVIIPSENHEKSVGCVINDLPPYLVDEVVVVDAYSTDRTVKIAREAGGTILQDKGTGFGHTVRAALKYLEAKARPEDIIVLLDAEYTYFSEELGELLEPVIKDEAELVISSRVREKMQKGAIPVAELFGMWVMKKMVKLKFKYNYHSPGIFRAIELKTLLKLNLKESKNSWLTEMLIRAAAEKIRIREVPLNFRKKVRSKNIFKVIIEVLVSGIQNLALFIRSS